MQKLVIASANKGKLKEIKEILGDKYDVVSMADVGFDADIEENGSSFEENALIKAKAVSDRLGVAALADDSGLCVAALDGAPGIYSARFSGKHGDDKANRRALLEKLDGITDRSAKFRCAVCLYFPDGSYLLTNGETCGSILEEERGNNGFGYDCLFFSRDLNKPFGEASDAEKNSVSHRYRALCDLLRKL